MITVLVVEDDETVARVHQRVVERVPGFVVVGSVTTGQEALRRVAVEKPALVVLDLYLPDISGVEVLRRIRGMGLGTDVMVISAAREAEMVREVLRAGAVDYLLKPFRVDRLMQSLADYREHLAELERAQELRQEEIDRWLGKTAGDPLSASEVPKGIDPVTLGHILAAVPAAEPGLTGSELAARTGVSRSTAHRYLRYLTTIGEVRAEPVYGSVGRPELLYRRESSPPTAAGSAPDAP